jgi:hypothetical protein
MLMLMRMPEPLLFLLFFSSSSLFLLLSGIHDQSLQFSTLLITLVRFDILEDSTDGENRLCATKGNVFRDCGVVQDTVDYCANDLDVSL